MQKKVPFQLSDEKKKNKPSLVLCVRAWANLHSSGSEFWLMTREALLSRVIFTTIPCLIMSHPPLRPTATTVQEILVLMRQLPITPTDISSHFKKERNPRAATTCFIIKFVLLLQRRINTLAGRCVIYYSVSIKKLNVTYFHTKLKCKFIEMFFLSTVSVFLNTLLIFTMQSS